MIMAMEEERNDIVMLAKQQQRIIIKNNITVCNNGYQNLRYNNIKSALLDSELLMAEVINKSREYIVLNLDKKINKKDFLNFQKMISLRSKGKPIAHLTNKKFFWKHEFS